MKRLTEKSELIRNVNDVFVFANNVNKFITHTPLPLERIDQELIGYPF
jgi:hypothetical protein